MGRGPTSKDVARLAGVSQSTVSYVMSGKRSISAETLRRVEEAMAALNYQPHAGARALAGSRTNTIAIVMPFVSDYVAGQLMEFVEEFVLAARRHDHDVLLVTAEEGIEGLRRIAGGNRCDAAVVMQVTARDERADLARSLDFPVVFFGVPDDPSGLACVDFDFEAAGRLLVEELVLHGSSRIDVLGWNADATAREYSYIVRFVRGVEGAASSHDVTLRWHREPASDSFVAALDSAPARDGHRGGVVLASGLSGGMRAIAARGLVPGRELGVAALCSVTEAIDQVVPLTAVSLPAREVSRAVADRLFGLLQQDRPDQGGVDVVPAALIRRASTRRS